MMRAGDNNVLVDLDVCEHLQSAGSFDNGKHID